MTTKVTAEAVLRRTKLAPFHTMLMMTTKVTAEAVLRLFSIYN